MAHPVFSRIGSSPLGRAGLATISILALAGFAAGGLPLTCRLAPGASFCIGDGTLGPQAAEPVPAASAEPAAASASPAPSAEPHAEAVETAMIEQAPALTQKDLVAATFEALRVELTSSQPEESELTTRKVKSVAINPDGTPVSPPAEAASPSEPETLVADAAEEPLPEPDPTAASELAAPPEEPAAAVEEDSVSTSLAYAPARGDAATVTGKGANVRSLPQKGGSEVLFALAGGAEVTIVEMRKGWAKIVDAQGRSGWIYGQYLTRG